MVGHVWVGFPLKKLWTFTKAWVFYFTQSRFAYEILRQVDDGVLQGHLVMAATFPPGHLASKYIKRDVFFFKGKLQASCKEKHHMMDFPYVDVPRTL